MKNIMILHGKEGSPNGSKVRYIKALKKYNVYVPDYRPKDEPVSVALPRCVAMVKNNITEFQPDLIIGSSFGGGVLLQLIRDGFWKKPSIFLAQAGVMYGVSSSLPANLPAILIHGKQDDIVSMQDSVTLANRHNQAELFLIHDGHRLQSILDETELLKFSIERLLK
jgi:hypothetical protein